jgi:hypothetical protein
MTPQTVHLRKIAREQVRIEAELKAVALSELQRAWRDVRMRLKQLDEQRPKVQQKNRLRKDAYFHADLWSMVESRLRSRLMEKLAAGAIALVAINNDYLLSVLGDGIELDSEAFANQYSDLLGQRITKTTETIRLSTSRKIVSWYNTPESTLQDITNDLSGDFGEMRAERIARTEIAYLDDDVENNIATQLGITAWWWSSKRDSETCTRKLIGPDGNEYKGCRELHGKHFTMDQPGPPEGSHVNCRCKKVLILESRDRP